VSGHQHKRNMLSYCWDSPSPDAWPVSSSAPLCHSQYCKGSEHTHIDSDGPVKRVIEHFKEIIQLKCEHLLIHKVYEKILLLFFNLMVSLHIVG